MVTIINSGKHPPTDNTTKPDKVLQNKKEAEGQATSASDQTSSKTDTKVQEQTTTYAQQPQVQSRNISFRLDRPANKVYIEVSDSDGNIIRTIPEDESEPAFKEMIADLKPGSFIDDKQ